MKIEIISPENDYIIQFSAAPSIAFVGVQVYGIEPFGKDPTEHKTKVAEFRVLLIELIASLQTLVRMK
jgi:hypothetical protein